MTHPRRPFCSSLTLLLAFMTACGTASERSASPSSGAEEAVTEPAPFGTEIEPGLRVGGQPTDAQLRSAQDEGTRLIISLRTPAEQGAEGEKEKVEGLGMRFVSIPIAGPEDLTEANARLLHQALGQEAQRPAILHCASGNRVGALLAIRARLFLGQSPEAALELGRRAGLSSLAGAVEPLLPKLQPATPAP